MAEEENKKVNFNEDGTPIKPGEDGYLYAGKYKSVEELEKGAREGEKKITELGQGKADSEKARQTLQDTISTAGKKAADAKLGDKEKAKKVRITGLKEAWAKGPEAALAFIEKLTDDRIASRGLLGKDEYQKGISDDRDLAAAYNKVRGTGDRRKEFDILKPDMGKLWGALPKEARVPEMVENIFFMAKGKASPEDLKTKIIEDLKAGVGQKGGSRAEEDTSTKDEKTVSDIAKAHEETKVF